VGSYEYLMHPRPSVGLVVYLFDGDCADVLVESICGKVHHHHLLDLRLSWIYFCVDRLEGPAIRHLSRACGKTDDQVHLSSEFNIISGA
jgi:hypothetical protein